MSSSEQHQSWSELNNQGVTCLNNSNFQRALNFFRSALMRISINSRQHDKYGSTLTQYKFANAIHPLSKNMEQSMMNDHTTQQQKQLKSNSFFFSTAIRTFDNSLNHTNDAFCFSSDPFDNAYIQSAIILFNIALTFHLQTIDERDPKIKRQLLTKSRDIYYKCNSILMTVMVRHDVTVQSLNKDEIMSRTSSVEATPTSGARNRIDDDYMDGRQTRTTTSSLSARTTRMTMTGNALIDLLLMALHNNIVQTSLELGESSESFSVWINQLIVCAKTIEHHYATNTIIGSERLSMLMYDYCNSFLLNALSWQLFIDAPAAAA